MRLLAVRTLNESIVMTNDCFVQKEISSGFFQYHISRCYVPPFSPAIIDVEHAYILKFLIFQISFLTVVCV
jgi:hypothetical protein